MRKTHIALAMAAGLGLSGVTQATLIDRGGGLIYDDDLNITWLSDANYAMTSGANANGQMNWANANAWAAGLIYGSYSDWRLPTTPQPDATCGIQSVGDSSGPNCTGSEMGHLFYSELGGTSGNFILTSGDPDLALFTNIQNNFYWSATEYAPNPTGAWHFQMSGGSQALAGKNSELFAWAVRPGDVAAAPTPGNVPEPATLLLLGLGLAGLGWARRRG